MLIGNPIPFKLLQQTILCLNLKAYGYKLIFLHFSWIIYEVAPHLMVDSIFYESWT